jgi:hypothetical protein
MRARQLANLGDLLTPMVFDRTISPSEPSSLWLGHSRKSLPRACPYLALSLIDSDLNQIASYAYAVLDNISFNEMISMEIGALVFLLFTCELVGYATGSRMTKDLTAQALWRAVRSKRPTPGLIHHSDRGTQYCADEYRKLVEQFGIQASMSRKGNCYDNAPMESFWGSLKNEMIHHQCYATRTNAEAAIKEYIEIFYNRQRRHSRLGYVSPAIFAENFSKAKIAA